MVVDEGTSVNLPRQRGYCFVVQHYGNTPVGAKHTYEVDLFASDRDTGERTPVDLEFKRTYRITDRASPDMPSYCFLRRGRDQFWLELRSSDGEWFDGDYTFVVSGN